MTNLIRSHPFEEMQRIQWQMDCLFDEFVGRPRSDSLVERLGPEPLWSASLNWAFDDNLAVDMVESDDAVTVRTSLPGVRPEDIEVEERDGWLSIRAQSKVDQAREEGGWHVRERRHGAWQRTLRLPASVNVAQADAQLQNGVLTVTLPKGKVSKPLFQRIQVNLPKLSLPKLGTKKDKVKVTRS